MTARESRCRLAVSPGTPMTASRTAHARASSTPGSSSTSWKCTSSSRAVSSARSTYRPTQKSASATRLSILVSSLLLLVLVGTAVGFGAAYRLRRKRRRLVGFGVPARRGGQYPGVLGAAALAGIDDQAPLP